jgi:hypothetical protein
MTKTFTFELTEGEIDLITCLVQNDLEGQVDCSAEPINDDNDPRVVTHNNILDKLFSVSNE